MKQLSDNKIVESWQKNVSPWITAIRNKEIASRVLVTNQAILEAVTRRAPGTVLDLGCGEGWLVRELAKTGIDVLGVDAVPEFIEFARQRGGGRYEVLPYAGLSNNVLQEKYDVVVSNFSLLGEESVNDLFLQIPSLLNQCGAFIVQTIHPLTGCANGKYEDGWREGTWAGFSENFSDPAPWYFRTIDTWKALFKNSGFTLSNVYEPTNEQTKAAASIVFVAE